MIRIDSVSSINTANKEDDENELEKITPERKNFKVDNTFIDNFIKFQNSFSSRFKKISGFVYNSKTHTYSVNADYFKTMKSIAKEKTKAITKSK